MTNTERARDTLMEVLGAELYKDISQFFINIQESKYTVILFISRRAFLIYKAFEKAGFHFPGKTVYSDRIVNRPGVEKDQLFKGKDVLLVEDSVTHAVKITNLFNQLNDKKDVFQCASVSMYVFTLNSERPKRFKPEIEKNLRYFKPTTVAELHNFSISITHLIHSLGMYYGLELPLYHCDGLSPEDFNYFQRRLSSIAGRWTQEPYKINIQDKTFDGNAFLVPVEPVLVLPYPCSLACVNFTSRHNKDGTYTVNFVPIVTMEHFDRVYAEKFFTDLPKSFREDCYPTKYVPDLINTSDDAAIACENLHRTFTYILSYCMGLVFRRDLNLDASKWNGKIVRASGDTHFSPDLFTFTSNMRFDSEKNDIALIQQLLPPVEMPVPAETPLDAADLDALAESLCDRDRNKLKHYQEYRDPQSALTYSEAIIHELKEQYIKNNVNRKVGFTQLFEHLQGDGDPIPDSIKRLVSMVMTEKSECSFDILIGDGQTSRVYKGFAPGENAFLEVYNDVPPVCFTAINEFLLGVGDYPKMLTHLDRFFSESTEWLNKYGCGQAQTKEKVRRMIGDEAMFNNYNQRVYGNLDSVSDSKWNDFAYDLGKECGV